MTDDRPAQTHQQLPKHTTDRQFERGTVWIAAGLAAIVTVVVSTASVISVLYGVHVQVRSSDKRDARTFQHQQEVLAVERWWSADAAMTFAEQDARRQAQSHLASDQAGSIASALRERLNALTAIGEEMQLFASTATFQASTNIVKDHLSMFDAVVALAACAHEHDPTIGTACDPERKTIDVADGALSKDRDSWHHAVLSDLKR